MALLRLPNETLSKILSLLPTRDIANTALVSHLFYHLAQLPLYRHLVLCRPNDPDTSPSALLLRTLLPLSTAKTSHTRSLYVSSAFFDDSREEDARLVQLLTLLPRLEYLELGSLYDLGGPDPEPFFGCLDVPRPALLPAGLQNIREFRAVAADPGDGISIELLILVMALPNLRTLTASVDDSNEGTRLFADTPGTSGITELELVHSTMLHTMLGGILQIPRSLTSFVYRLPADFSYHLGELGRALLPLKESVARLVLDFTFVNRESDQDIEDDGGTIGTFRDWPQLQTLDCQLMLLFGRTAAVTSVTLPDLLPPGLNTLCIRKDHYWNIQQVVDQLVLVLEHNLGGLRAVGVGCELAAHRDRLAGACEAAGVELVEWWSRAWGRRLGERSRDLALRLDESGLLYRLIVHT